MVGLCNVAVITAFSISTANALNVGGLKRPVTRLSSPGKSNVVSASAIAVPFPEVTSASDDTTPKSRPLAPEDSWIAQLDYDGFGKEVTQLGRELVKEQGQEDVNHLNKIVSWRNIAAFVGVATMWMTPNPLTILALSTWTYASWTMIAHHTCHGGYNRVDAGKFNSRGFALGSLRKRIDDWLDWMHPEAWNVEHNRLHHYRLNELHDPDLVQRNADFVREMNAPMFVKYFAAAALFPIWKWFYYAPNTYKQFQLSKLKTEGKTIPKNLDPLASITLGTLVAPKDESEKVLRDIVNPREFFAKVLAPFLVCRFIALPLPLLLIPGIGPKLYSNAFINLLAAELLTNIHGFVTIATNHAGADLYTFDDAVKPKTGSFYVRQIVGSTNFKAGTDLVDFSQGWLNYQIEHHVYPDFSMLQYQKAAPKLKAICEKYGVPYIQENVFTRVAKTLDIMVGKATMREFPTEYEPPEHKTATVTWKSSNGAIDDE